MTLTAPLSPPLPVESAGPRKTSHSWCPVSSTRERGTRVSPLGIERQCSGFGTSSLWRPERWPSSHEGDET
jgi:hypothetical protein